jgi:hypothetical protein
VFRNAFGRPHLDAGLLELKDFAPEDLAEGISDSLLIDSAILCQLLNEAEEEEQKTKQDRGVVHTTSALECKETTSGRDATRRSQF